MRIYSLTILLSAFLLFQIEPLIAKYIQPWFGGAPSVWTTCLLFFQMLLLAGYTYAHLIGTRLAPRRQAIAHLMLIGTCVIAMILAALLWKSPILPAAGWKTLSDAYPVARILMLLFASIGLPYFALSATAPLLQSWYARVRKDSSPYRLYSISNLGSLIALLSYPFAVEPTLTLRSQANLWSCLYVAFAIGMSLSAIPLLRAGSLAQESDESRSERLSPATRTLWVVLPASASVLLFAGTSELTQNTAPIPFLWVLPLALYLLSFIICFDSELWYRRGLFHPLFAGAIVTNLLILVYVDRIAATLGKLVLTPMSMILVLEIGSVLLVVFAGCMVCHGELVRIKPHSRDLTTFYLMVSAGGALGGVFSVVVAPLLFRGFWDFRFAVWLCVVLMAVSLIRDRESWVYRRSFAAGIAILGTAIALLAVIYVNMIAIAMHGAVFVTRNFYGIFRVVSSEAPDHSWHSYRLLNGRITHGAQFFSSTFPRLRYYPTTYYCLNSGVGLVMMNHPRRSHPNDSSLRVGVVGLGVGTVAAWGRPGDYLRFYEINPAVIALATNPNGYFSYIRDSSAQVEIVSGDARLSMERELAEGRSQQFDVLVVDAFTGDAVPTHLLTREAMLIYLRQLKPDGVLAVHVSNLYLDLRPLLAEHARTLNLHYGFVHVDEKDSVDWASDWVLLSRDDKIFKQPEISGRLGPRDKVRRVRPWTDDYSNLFQLLN